MVGGALYPGEVIKCPYSKNSQSEDQPQHIIVRYDRVEGAPAPEGEEDVEEFDWKSGDIFWTSIPRFVHRLRPVSSLVSLPN